MCLAATYAAKAVVVAVVASATAAQEEREELGNNCYFRWTSEAKETTTAASELFPSSLQM
jgi:hypothetical protein